MRRTLIAIVCVSLGGCDKLFSLTHIDRDADIDAAPCPPRSVATGKDHTCSVDHLGRVFCWGLNTDKQIQSGGPDHLLTPTRVVLPAAAQVTSGRDFSCARLEDGDVWCWGNNTCVVDAAGQVSCAGAKDFLADGDKSSSVPTLTVRSGCAE